MIDKTVFSNRGPSGGILLSSSLIEETVSRTHVSSLDSMTKVLGIPPVKACLEAVPGVRWSKNWNKIKY
jgi:hypothetical protein